MTSQARRSAGHDTGYKAQFVSALELESLVGPWSALYDSCVEANPFYGPDYLLPLAAGPLAGVDWHALVIWRRDQGGQSSMAAMLPLSPHRRLLAPLRALRHPYIVGGAPLLDASDPVSAAISLLDAICELYPRPIVVFDDLRLDWPAVAALQAACEKSNRPILVFDEYFRPGVAGDGSAAKMDRSLAKNLRRRKARLSEQGDWSICAQAGGDDDPRALEDFLNLELGGWKGQKGTALASRKTTLEFVIRAFDRNNKRPGVRFETLRQGGRAIAANVNLIAPGHAAAVKAAYDENYAAFSPGLLLDAAVAESVSRECWTPYLDSVAMPGHPLEKLWRSPVRAGSIALAPDRRKTARDFDARVNVERLRRLGREFAKEIYNSIR